MILAHGDSSTYGQVQTGTYLWSLSHVQADTWSLSHTHRYTLIILAQERQKRTNPWHLPTNQPSLFCKPLVPVRKPASKNMVDSFWRTIPKVDLWPPHTHTHMNKHTYKHIQEILKNQTSMNLIKFKSFHLPLPPYSPSSSKLTNFNQSSPAASHEHSKNSLFYFSSRNQMRFQSPGDLHIIFCLYPV